MNEAFDNEKFLAPKTIRVLGLILIVGAWSLILSCLWFFRGYFQVEMARFSPFEIFLLFLFDVYSMLYLTAFCVSAIITGRVPNNLSPKRKLWMYAITVTIFSLGTDFVATSYSAYQEWRYWNDAVVTNGSIIDIQAERTSNYDRYLVTYEYYASDEARHTGMFRMNDCHNQKYSGVIQKDLSAEIIRKVREYNIGAPLAVRYSDDWPSKSWADNLKWDGDGDTLISLMLILYPVYLIFFVLFSLIGYQKFRQSNLTITWINLSATLSQITTIGMLATVGFIIKAFIR